MHFAQTLLFWSILVCMLPNIDIQCVKRLIMQVCQTPMPKHGLTMACITNSHAYLYYTHFHKLCGWLDITNFEFAKSILLIPNTFCHNNVQVPIVYMTKHFSNNTIFPLFASMSTNDKFWKTWDGEHIKNVFLFSLKQKQATFHFFHAHRGFWQIFLDL